jgi:hypothetical protein
MATQSTAAADVADEAPPATTIASLPHELLARVLARVPVDTRLRCCEVSAGWCDFLASERSLWTALDFSPSSGVTHRVTDALLRAAAAKAGGALTSLDLPFRMGASVSHKELLEVVTVNADSLLEARALALTFFEDDVERLLRAAPRLRLLVADVECNMDDAARMLRNEGLFQPLRVRKLNVWPEEHDVAALQALAAALAVHAAPVECIVFEKTALDAPDVLDALVDAAVVNGLSTCTFDFCCLSPASVPSLVRLLGSGGALTSLNIIDSDPHFQGELLDTPAAVLLGGALRTHSTFEELALITTDLWCDADAATILLTSLVAHPTLRKLDVSLNNAAEHGACAGTALFALVAANAPALTELDVSYCHLGDEGLRPLFEALPRNRHLRTLTCHNNDMSEAFAHDVLLPAMRANTSLTTLEAQ